MAKVAKKKAVAPKALSLATVHMAIACAIASGCRAQPDAANGVLINELKTNLGPIVQEIVTVIEGGLTNLPAILAALTAAGVTLPSWTQLLITILIPLVAKPA